MEPIEAKEILQERNLRATNIRQEVIQLIASQESAIPFSLLQQNLKDFDRVTLYRTINTLIEKGVIHKAFVEGDENFFAICEEHCSSHNHKHHHIHFKCNNCKEVYCIEPKNNITLNLPGFNLESFEIGASGICKNCNNA